MKISKVVKVVLVSLVVLFATSAPMLAQEPKFGTDADKAKVELEKAKGPQSVTFSGAGIAAGLGMGLSLIGAGIGLGRIGSAALEAMARQPEVAARAQTAMIIIAAMLEGATLASVALSFVVGLNVKF